MAISVERYTVSSKTLVGQLVPFFLRGKKVLQFLAAISAPLDSVNSVFQKWCRDTLIDAATTSQIIVLKWSMKEKLKQYFTDENASFQFDTYGRTEYTTVYEDQSEQLLHSEATNIYMPEDVSDDSITDENAKVVIRDRIELSDEDNDLTIIAPVHNSKISDDEYIRKIKQCFEPYLAYDMEYTISINKN
jgi:hypothetical protein